MNAFRSGKIKVLVATDIAARGLDIEQLPQVVNFDLPNVSEDYVHRIGRTGRAGQTGRAISLVSADEVDLLSDIERLIQQLLPREEVEGYEPKHAVPETTLRAPVKPKKPRKALNRETGAGNNSRQGKKSSGRSSGYGQGPKPGKKRKSGGRNQTSKSSKSRDAGNSPNSQKKSPSKGKSASSTGKSLYGSGGGNSSNQKSSRRNANRGRNSQR